MAFLTKFFTCCQSSKNIEAEKEHLELRLSSPRFPQASAPPSQVIHDFAQTVQERLNDDCQNDQTFNQADESDVGKPKQGETNSVQNYNNISFEILKDTNIEPSHRENSGKEVPIKREIENEVVFDLQEDSKCSSSSPKFQVENKNKFSSDNKGFKKSKTLKKDEYDGFKEKAPMEGILARQITKKEEESNNKDNYHIYRRNITREALNSSPRLMVKNT